MSDVKKGMMSQRKPRKQQKTAAQTVTKKGASDSQEKKSWYKTPLGYAGIAAMVVGGILLGGWLVTSLALGDLEQEPTGERITLTVVDDGGSDVSSQTTVAIYSFTSEQAYGLWDDKIMNSSSFTWRVNTTASALNYTVTPVADGIYTRYYAKISYVSSGYTAYTMELVPGRNQVRLFPLPSWASTMILNSSDDVVGSLTGDGSIAVSFSSNSGFASMVDFLNEQFVTFAINCTFNSTIGLGSMNATGVYPYLSISVENITSTSAIIWCQQDVGGLSGNSFEVDVVIDDSVELMNANVIYGVNPPIKVYA